MPLSWIAERNVTKLEVIRKYVLQHKLTTGLSLLISVDKTKIKRKVFWSKTKWIS